MSDRVWLGTWFVAAIVSYVAAHAGSRIGLSHMHPGGVRTAYVLAMISAIVGVGAVVAASVRLFGRAGDTIRALILSVGSALAAYFGWTIVTIIFVSWVPPIWIGVYAAMSGAAVLVCRGAISGPVR